jgi:hypothetical protein
MADYKILDALREIALMLDKCAEDVPYELSAQDGLYFRIEDAAQEARALMKELEKK